MLLQFALQFCNIEIEKFENHLRKFVETQAQKMQFSFKCNKHLTLYMHISHHVRILKRKQWAREFFIRNQAKVELLRFKNIKLT